MLIMDIDANGWLLVWGRDGEPYWCHSSRVAGVVNATLGKQLANRLWNDYQDWREENDPDRDMYD